MLKTITKKFLAIMLTFAMLCTILISGTTEIKAADKFVNIMHKVSTATAYSPINYNFTLSETAEIYFLIRTNERTGVTISIKEPDHDIPSSSIVLAATNPNWTYISSNGTYENAAKTKLKKGNYILKLTFENDINYDMSVNRLLSGGTLNKTKTTITKGFSDTLKVSGASIQSCSSSNKKIVTVNNKGKITAKKNGTATVKVHLTNGKTLSCKVKVASNKYTAKKPTVSSNIYNTCNVKAYNAKFDFKGNIVVKFRFVNNSYGKITGVPKFKMTITNKNKKAVAIYSKGNYAISVLSYNQKDCTVVIPKPSLKMKKKNIDLHTCKISITGDFANATM